MARREHWKRLRARVALILWTRNDPIRITECTTVFAIPSPKSSKAAMPCASSFLKFETARVLKEYLVQNTHAWQRLDYFDDQRLGEHSDRQYVLVLQLPKNQ